MKQVFNFAALLFAGLLLTSCATDKELRKLESAYQAQLGEYATALKSGEITKAEHDKKVTQLNRTYNYTGEVYNVTLEDRAGPKNNRNEQIDVNVTILQR